jgi:hypothetical protein
VLGPNPGELVPAGVSTAGKTSVAWEGGKPAVTFPIPGVPGAIAKATLDAKYFAERVVVKLGSTSTEFTYSDYRDWNNPLNKIEAFYAGKMTERRNGTTVRDLTTVKTETGQVYVVVPVPASVRAAITVTAQPPTWTQPGPPPSPAANQPTPRLANGKPDLTGNWTLLRVIQLGVMGTTCAVHRKLSAARKSARLKMVSFTRPGGSGRAGPCTNPSYGTSPATR